MHVGFFDHAANDTRELLVTQLPENTGVEPGLLHCAQARFE